MQPARMKKIQSLDYATTGPSSSLADKTGPDGRRPIVVGARSGASRPGLMHSVSIVVDLATTPNNSSGAQFGSCGSTSSHGSTSGSSSIEEGPTGASRPAASKTGASHNQGSDLEMLVRSAEPGGAVGSGGQVNQNDNKNCDDDDDHDGDDDDEDDEDDDMDACLSSQLARRVVLVDEADKIFMRNRARSAEPQVLRKTLADFHSRPSTPKPQCEPTGLLWSPPHQPPPPTSSATTAKAVSPSLIRAISRRPRHSVASFSATSDTRGGDGGSGSGVGVGGDIGSAWSEMAERAELGKPSMRRNTHHHVNFMSPTLSSSFASDTNNNRLGGDTLSPATFASSSSSSSSSSGSQALVMRSSGQAHSPFNNSSNSNNSPAQQFASSLKQQQSSRYFQIDNHNHQQKYSPIVGQFSSAGRFSSCAPTSQSNRQSPTPIRAAAAAAVASRHQQQRQQTPPPPPIQHRRQSLQISLLSGACRDTSRSLTEEELRGEREFNEQVRCAARSPDIGALLSNQHHQINLRQQQQPQQDQLKGGCGSRTWASSDIDLELCAVSGEQAISSEATTGDHHLSQQTRCHSTSGTFRPLPESEPLAVAAKQYEQENSKQPITTIIKKQQLLLPTTTTSAPGGARRRRVSFGSIDPIVLDRGQQDDRGNRRLGSSSSSSTTAESFAGGLSVSGYNKRQRASICDPLGVSAGGQHHYQTQLRAGSGILKKLERIQAQPASSLTKPTTPPPLVAFSQSGRDIKSKHEPQQQQSIRTSDVEEVKASNQSDQTSGRRSSSGGTGCLDDKLTHTSESRTATSCNSSSNKKQDGDKCCSSEMMMDENKTTANSSSGPVESDDLSPATFGSTISNTRIVHNACPRRTRLASVGGEPVFVTTTTSATTPTKVQHQQYPEDCEARPAGRKATNLHARRHQSMSIGGGGGATASGPSERDDNRVQSIMANAKLRQEEFARLLEEHEQIVNEINRFETEISTAAAAAAAAGQQQQQDKLDLANKKRAATNHDSEHV